MYSLRRELRDSVQTRLSSRPSVGAGEVGGEGDIVENLTQQVEIAVQVSRYLTYLTHILVTVSMFGPKVSQISPK